MKWEASTVVAFTRDNLVDDGLDEVGKCHHTGLWLLCELGMAIIVASKSSNGYD